MSLWHIDPPPLQGNKRAKARGQRGWSWGEEMSNVSGVLQEEGVGASLHLSPCERSFKGTSWGACPQESEMHQGLVSDQSERLQLWAGSLQSQCKLWATWGHSPCSGRGEAEFQPTCSSSPYGPCSRAHPFFSGVISNPAPKDRPKWWVYSLFSHHPREITEATIVQITGRTTNIPAGAFQEPMEALSARINVLSLPAQRLWTSNICCGQRRPMLCVIVGS